MADRIVRIGRLSAEALKPLFVDLEIRHTGTVSGTFTVSDLQGLSLTRSRTHGGAFQVLRLQSHIRRSAAHAFYACVPMRGSVTLAQEGRTCTLTRGDIGLMDSRTEYTLGMPEDLDALWVAIAPESLESRLASTSKFVARRLDGSQGLGLIASRFILATASQSEALAKQRIAPVASILMDLLCAAAANEGEPGTKVLRSGALTLERAKTFIDHHLAEEDLNPALIAAGVGISARYLADLFAQEGTTIMGWTKRRRLDLTRLALEGTAWGPGTIADAAYRHGFTNISSFNRAFIAEFGRSPRKFMR